MLLDQLCLKLDWQNAFMMIEGYERPGKFKHQSIWVETATRRYPKLITLNRSPTGFDLSAFGKSLDVDGYSTPLKYVAMLDSEYFIRNDMALWRTVCTNGLFDVWEPISPFRRLDNSGRRPELHRIHLLRVYEIERAFTSQDVHKKRVDHLVSPNREVTIIRPVITEEVFRAMRELLEASVSDYLRESQSYVAITPAGGIDTPHDPAEQLQDTAWSESEISAAVDAYLEMLALEQRREPYTKAEFNDLLRQGPLSSRTKSSVEYRMQNISAVIEDLGQKRIEGYVPARNVGATMRKQIADVLTDRGFPDISDYEPTVDPEELANRSKKLRERGFWKPPQGTRKPLRAASSRSEIQRDPAVHGWILDNAHGGCELCGEPAPFENRRGEPYLEVHHVIFLADDGPDVPENAVALCPNCHRRCHHSKDSGDARDALYSKVERLEEQKT